MKKILLLLSILALSLPSIVRGADATLSSEIDAFLKGGPLDAGAGNDLIFQLGDNAGANKLSIQDSDSAEVFKVDSDGQMLASDGTSSLPGISFLSNPDSGILGNGSFLRFINNGSEQLRVGTGVSYFANAIQGQSLKLNPTAFSGGDYVTLTTDAANTLALRNGTAAQESRIYNTYTDASNGEWLELGFQDTTNTAVIKTNANGTGTRRELKFESESEFLFQTTGGTERSLFTDSFTRTIMEPDVAQGITDDLLLMKFPAEKYPDGVTITSIHIDASAAYTSETFLFEHWDDAAGTTQATVESITTTGISAEDDGTLTDATIPADYFLMVNLDDTPEDKAYVAITVTFTY